MLDTPQLDLCITLSLAVFTKHYCFRVFSKHSESFEKFRGHFLKNTMFTYYLVLKILHGIFE